MVIRGLLLLLALTPVALGAYQVSSISNIATGGQVRFHFASALSTEEFSAPLRTATPSIPHVTWLAESHCIILDPLQTPRYVCSLVDGTQGPYGDDISFLTVDVIPYTNSIVRVTIRDANTTRWEVPDVVMLQPQKSVAPQYNVTIAQVGNLFNLKVTRLKDSLVIFDTTSMPAFVYENQYLTISTKLPEQPNIYGLGERAAPLRLPLGQIYTIFARDNATPLLQNVYGAHAFYMELRGGQAHGVYLLNSNAMDVLLDSGKLQYKVIGGVLDFFFFVGPTPQEVTRQYLSVIGTTEMIPYWSLGWQQCRWGYNTLAETKAVVDSYAANNIPLEVMWNDIDYMDAYKDFTTDPVRFPADQMKAWIDSLHSKGQKYIMIIDPGIKVESGYAAYEEGLKADLYIKNEKGNNLLGKVWPGYTFFPDFTHPATPGYWKNQLTKFHEIIPFDGIWIDMNEVANFCDGECSPTTPVGFNRNQIAASVNAPRLDFASTQNTVQLMKQKQEDFEMDVLARRPGQSWRTKSKSHGAKLNFDPNNPPYKPVNGGNPMNSHTIDLSAKQYLSLQYNIHSLYGHYEGKATRSAADSIFKKRSLIVSRSTFAGSGRHMSHWLGDNHSTWDDLHESIAGVITMGLFGLPHVGADICGFAGNTTKELCTRWIQLGAFYPFSRDHNAIGAMSQEPYVFGPDVATIAAKTIKIKYALLNYYYTLHYHAHTTGDPVARGLFYHFPQDPLAVDNDVQMMIGPHLLVSPVLVDGARILNTYLPAAIWYDFYTGARINSNGASYQLDAPIDKINLHIRGGGIIPMQQGAAMTTAAVRRQAFSLMVAMDEQGSAHGDLFLDDGESFNTIQNKQYSYITFEHGANTLRIHAPVTKYTDVMALTQVTFLGVKNLPSSVAINGVLLSKTKWTYSSSLHRLFVHDVSVNLLSDGGVIQYA